LNWLEKKLPKKVRDRFRTSIVTALGFFLALQYNETIVAVLAKLFPIEENGIWARIIYVLAITIVIVYVTVWIEKALDGK
jgi:uncharacterized membrane protein required for colicin V production